eukprot:3174599-Amphidinium_carterae.1
MIQLSKRLQRRVVQYSSKYFERFVYNSRNDQDGWAAYRMPISPDQADALFCEFMPDVQDERAWLAGSSDVRVVEVGWAPFVQATCRPSPYCVGDGLGPCHVWHWL